MSFVVPFVLIGWAPLVMLMFGILPARRAVILAFVMAWMFLPVAGYKFAGFPQYDKMSATSLAVLLSTLIFQPGRFSQFRMSIWDLPMLGFCLAPFVSLQMGGFPLATSSYWAIEQALEWGVPYLLGRLYIRDLDDVHELVRVLVICGLIYVPFCLYEIKMSPQLNRTIYGFTQHSWGSTKRGGGWRPLVFMQTGLMVATWMCSVAVLAFWGWRRRAIGSLWGIPIAVVALILLLTAVLCKSAGATVLMGVAIATLVVTHLTRSRWLLILLIAAPLIYVSSRVTGVWDGKWLMAAARNISEDRSDSIKSRLGSEDNFIRHTLKRPLFGWGPGPQASPPVDERVQSKAVWDALWIINFAKYGAFGLLAWILVGAVPGMLFLKGFGAATWSQPAISAGLALIVVVACYQIDCLFNGMVQPVFSFAFGGITSVALARQRTLSCVSAANPSRRLVSLIPSHI
jgi:hypothetical protein